MSFDANGILNQLISVAQASGLFDQVNGHEPASIPASGVTAGVWLQSIGPSKKVSGLASTAARVEYLMRLYTPGITGNLDWIEPNMTNAAAVMIGALSAEFTLGGEVFATDLLGAWGNPLAGKAGWVDQAGQKMRIIDITVPFLVDNVWEQVA
ncbi:MAG TPA: hypothetical protein VHX38_18925 [Pseudonocardiaceae bacterium]|jgi:hypothetical protein|nr:hypothetical protein [Pseudonocardiaceae bacterium]